MEGGREGELEEVEVASAGVSPKCHSTAKWALDRTQTLIYTHAHKQAEQRGSRSLPSGRGVERGAEEKLESLKRAGGGQCLQAAVIQPTRLFTRPGLSKTPFLCRAFLGPRLS